MTIKTDSIKLPQANSIDLLYRIFKSCETNGTTIEKVAFENGINNRTAKYYLDALVFLNFILKNRSLYIWNLKLFNQFLNNDINIDDFREMMLISKNFREIVIKYINEKLDITKIMPFLESKYNISGSTLIRRSQCLEIWIKEILYLK